MATRDVFRDLIERIDALTSGVLRVEPRCRKNRAARAIARRLAKRDRARSKEGR